MYVQFIYLDHDSILKILPGEFTRPSQSVRSEKQLDRLVIVGKSTVREEINLRLPMLATWLNFLNALTVDTTANYFVIIIALLSWMPYCTEWQET